MNQLQVYENERFGKIRTLEEDGKVLFCGKDVAVALGYSNTIDAISRHCRWVVKRDLPHPQSPGKTIEASFIPEGDLYRLITHSKLESAQEFEAWVFDEVLPSIRSTGRYETPAYVAGNTGYDQQVDRLTMLATECIKLANTMINAQIAYAANVTHGVKAEPSTYNNNYKVVKSGWADQVIEMRRSGMTYEEIASYIQQFGIKITGMSVYRFCSAYGIGKENQYE